MAKEKILTSAIRKGAKILLTHDRFATVEDNRRNSFIREVRLIGIGIAEIGSTYVSDWVKVRIDDIWYDIELTQKQVEKAVSINEALKMFYHG